LYSKRKEILCVHQDDLTRQVRRMLLEHFGYKVLTTASVRELHSILQQRCPDMLLLDTSDPELDWEQISERAKAICPDILSVVLTPDSGRLSNGHETVDRFLRIDAPREEWLSGIEALFARQAPKGAASSNMTA